MRQLSIEELDSIELSKWPRLLVKGDRVTPDQASEIIFRTTDFGYLGYLSGNDWDKIEKVYQCLGIELESVFRCLVNKDSLSKFHDSVGSLADHIGHLANHWVMSAWIGGPHGWVNFDGSIRALHYNIGKDPCARGVYFEWVKIAKAFPYLNLKCQLVNDEGEGNIAIEYIVRNGEVAAYSEPNEELFSKEEIDSANDLVVESFLSSMGINQLDEMGVTFEWLEDTFNKIKNS